MRPLSRREMLACAGAVATCAILAAGQRAPTAKLNSRYYLVITLVAVI